MRRRGFSLLEVLMALALLAVLSGAMSAFLLGLQDRTEGMRREAARRRIAAVMFDRLNVALRLAEPRGPDGGAGVKGDATSLEVCARGVSPAAGPGLVRVLCETDADVRTVSVTIAGEGEVGEVVEGDLRRVRVRYHDGDEWRDSFDSVAAGGLPVAVEVSVWFGTAVEPAVQVGIEATPTDDNELDDVAPDRVRVFAVGDARGAGGGEV